jgi:hypothetical protein
MIIDFGSRQENWQQAQLPNNTKSYFLSRIISTIYVLWINIGSEKIWNREYTRSTLAVAAT